MDGQQDQSFGNALTKSPRELPGLSVDRCGPAFVFREIQTRVVFAQHHSGKREILCKVCSGYRPSDGVKQVDLGYYAPKCPNRPDRRVVEPDETLALLFEILIGTSSQQ